MARMRSKTRELWSRPIEYGHLMWQTACRIGSPAGSLGRSKTSVNLISKIASGCFIREFIQICWIWWKKFLKERFLPIRGIDRLQSISSLGSRQSLHLGQAWRARGILIIKAGSAIQNIQKEPRNRFIGTVL